MLKVQEQQMAHLAALVQADFVAATCSYLRERYPDPCAPMSDDVLAALVRRGMEAARGYGIDAARDVRRYIDLMFQLGPDFDREVAWARSILNRPDFSGQIRIDVLCAAHEGRIPDSPEDGPFFP